MKRRKAPGRDKSSTEQQPENATVQISERLQKIMATAGLGSRRCDEGRGERNEHRYKKPAHHRSSYSRVRLRRSPARGVDKRIGRRGGSDVTAPFSVWESGSAPHYSGNPSREAQTSSIENAESGASTLEFTALVPQQPHEGTPQ